MFVDPVDWVVDSSHSVSQRKKRSKHWIRPDFHIDTDKYYHEMSMGELIHGMTCVLDCLTLANLPSIPASQYADHLRFVSLKGQKGLYTDEALARYEFSVTSRLLDGKIDRYTACLLYTSPSPRDKRQSRMPSSA